MKTRPKLEPPPLLPRDVRRRARGAALIAAVLLSLAPPARAETTAADRIAAESLFAEGRQLLQAGEYARACAKFEASLVLEEALGARLNLADCYEKLGRTASAWAAFKSAAADAQRAGDAARKAAAIQRADALEPKLTRLRIELEDEALSREPSQLAGLVLLRDGEPVSHAVLGNAIPVDPGTHVLRARAPGKAPWSESVEVRGEGAVIEVRVPPLRDAPPPLSEPAVVMTTESAATQRTLAWVIGGVGVAAVAAGGTFGLLAASSWSKAKDGCAAYPYECGADGVRRGETADTQATLATLGFVVGGLALGTSALLLLTDSSEATAEVGLSPGRISLRGRF